MKPLKEKKSPSEDVELVLKPRVKKLTEMIRKYSKMYLEAGKLKILYAKMIGKKSYRDMYGIGERKSFFLALNKEMSDINGTITSYVDTIRKTIVDLESNVKNDPRGYLSPVYDDIRRLASDSRNVLSEYIKAMSKIDEKFAKYLR